MASRAQRRIAKRYGLHNVWAMHRASKTVGLPFEVACALMEKESGGRNIYGNDVGGTFAGRGEVTKENYQQFRHLVVVRGYRSNGVGPSQITYRGFFPQMEGEGLRPWVPYDNMLFGFRLLKSYYNKYHSWRIAGRLYNGTDAYGVDLVNRINTWKRRFASA